MMRAAPDDLPIRLAGVAARYGDRTALSGVDLEIARGAPTALLGPNGCGKSTLLRLAMGLLAPSAGVVTWGGRTEARAGARAIVFQRPVFLRRSAAANIDYVRARAAPGRTPRTASELLARVGLAGCEDRPARKLSGGEQQRLALARALALRPDVLFLDEPTASLDPAASRAVEEIVAGVAAEGVKIIFATHDMGQARRLAGDVVFLLRGRVHERRAAADFFGDAASAEAKAFRRGDLVV